MLLGHRPISGRSDRPVAFWVEAFRQFLVDPDPLRDLTHGKILLAENIFGGTNVLFLIVGRPSTVISA